jgi:molybdate transport system permease protein
MTELLASGELWSAVWLTLRLALVSSLVLLVLGIPLANWLNNCKARGVILLETLVSLPIVLPPTVIGFYLLVLMAPQRPLGAAWVAVFGHPLPFSFAGLVLGSVVYSLPFAVQPFQAARADAAPGVLVDRAAAVAPRDPYRRIAQLCPHDGRVWRGADVRREYPGADAGRVDRAVR